MFCSPVTSCTRRTRPIGFLIGSMFMGETSVITGRLKWFNESKGFGFIQRDDVANGKDVFLHASEVKKNPALDPSTLVEGALLHFEVQDAPRGPKAVNVQLQT